MELEFVEGVMNMHQYAKIHQTLARLRETFWEGFACSCVGFLFCNNMLKVLMDQATIKKDTKYLQQHAMVTYFEGSK